MRSEDAVLFDRRWMVGWCWVAVDDGDVGCCSLLAVDLSVKTAEDRRLTLASRSYRQRITPVQRTTTKKRRPRRIGCAEGGLVLARFTASE
jgi:hypothetical protein